MMKSSELNIAYSIRRDEDLWDDLRSGDRKALDHIYYSQVAALMSYGKLITPNSALVDDCIQDIFIDIWVKRERLGATSSIRFYLMKALKRRLFRRLKQERKSKCFSDFADGFEKLGEQVHADAVDQQSHKSLIKSLNTLSPTQREIVYLKYYNNLSLEEISDILDLNRKQTYNALSKAMLKLRSILQLLALLSFLHFS